MSYCQPLVILIEDHPLVRLSQRMLCEQAGYRVVEFDGTAEPDALDIAGAGGAVIIADYDLGTGRTGIDVARAVMRRAGRPIPTLVLSGSLGEHSLPASRAAGLPLMFKPATEELLLGWIAGAIAGQ